MSTIGRLDIEEALAHKTSDVLEGNWQVAAAEDAGTKTFTVSLMNPAAVTPNVGTADAANFENARILFWGGNLSAGGAANRGFSTEVASVASTVTSGTVTTTVTVKDAIPAPLVVGDTFTIFRTIAVSMTASENVAEVGGASVPTVNGVPSLPTARQVVQASLADASGSTDATASTSTVALAADSVTQYLLIQNASTTSGDDLWVNFGADASAGSGSLLLGAGAALTWENGLVPTQSINVLSAVVSVPYTLKYA